ncbi:MAG: acyl carrier protein [Desulfobacteraceae bacterium]|nr:MAG: acyl carrier protein [Desulfobacteraceae bacterium]
MNIRKDQVDDLVLKALQEIDLDDRSIEFSKSTILYGDNGLLESIQLVNFIVDLEKYIEDEFSRSLSIADEKAISQKNSPFRTIETLCNYVYSLLTE